MKRIYDKIIFLDIDGVLNNLGLNFAYESKWVEADPISVLLVSRLIKEAGAKVVISSSWRIGCKDVEAFRYRMMNEWKERLNDADLSGILDNVVDLTPSLNHAGRIRGQEIKSWLDDHPVTSYVILDDDSDMLPEQKPFFVQTKFIDGFRMEHYWRALKILAPEHKHVRDLEVYFDKKWKPVVHQDWPN